MKSLSQIKARANGDLKQKNEDYLMICEDKNVK